MACEVVLTVVSRVVLILTVDGPTGVESIASVVLAVVFASVVNKVVRVVT